MRKRDLTMYMGKVKVMIRSRGESRWLCSVDKEGVSTLIYAQAARLWFISDIVL